MILRDIHGNEVEVTVNPKHLAHCRACCQPLYCIYDADLRWFCWECENPDSVFPDNHGKGSSRLLKS